jgi:excisionase family DNA binding protein
MEKAAGIIMTDTMRGRCTMNDLSVNEAAEQLHVSSGTVRRWIGAGKLPAICAGRSWRIRQVDVARLTSNGRPVAAAPDRRHKAGTAGALAEYLRTHRPIASQEDVAELERMLREGRHEARRQASAV